MQVGKYMRENRALPTRDNCVTHSAMFTGYDAKGLVLPTLDW